MKECFGLLQDETEELDVESEDTEKVSAVAAPSPPATRSTRSRNNSPQKPGSLSPRIPTRQTAQVSKPFVAQEWRFMHVIMENVLINCWTSLMFQHFYDKITFLDWNHTPNESFKFQLEATTWSRKTTKTATNWSRSGNRMQPCVIGTWHHPQWYCVCRKHRLIIKHLSLLWFRTFDMSQLQNIYLVCPAVQRSSKLHFS